MTASGGRPEAAASGRPGVTAGAAAASPRQLERLRGATMGALVMLIIQFAIGMIVNLYSTIPAGDQHSSFWAAIGRALADGPAALTVHAILGLLLVLATVSLVVRAVACRHVPVIVTSSIGLLAVLAAASSGSRFVSTGSNGASIGMAMATAVAMLCYAVSLYILGSRRAG
jgi:hypothetical protein